MRWKYCRSLARKIYAFEKSAPLSASNVATSVSQIKIVKIIFEMPNSNYIY